MLSEIVFALFGFYGLLYANKCLEATKFIFNRSVDFVAIRNKGIKQSFFYKYLKFWSSEVL
jgi:hypothetical protein